MKCLWFPADLVSSWFLLTGRCWYNLERAPHISSFSHCCRMCHRPGTQSGTRRTEGLFLSPSTSSSLTCIFSVFCVTGCGLNNINSHTVTRLGIKSIDYHVECVYNSLNMCLVCESRLMLNVLLFSHRMALQWWGLLDTMQQSPLLSKYNNMHAQIRAHTHRHRHTHAYQEPGGLCKVFQRIYYRSAPLLRKRERVGADVSLSYFVHVSCVCTCCVICATWANFLLRSVSFRTQRHLKRTVCVCVCVCVYGFVSLIGAISQVTTLSWDCVCSAVLDTGYLWDDNDFFLMSRVWEAYMIYCPHTHTHRHIKPLGVYDPCWHCHFQHSLLFFIHQHFSCIPLL